MSLHISYHPLGTDTIRRYVGYLSSQDPAGLAAIEYDASDAHPRFRSAFIDMASSAQTMSGRFDTSHGLNLAVTQGFFGRFHYVHGARLSALHELLEPYTQTWHQVLPTWPATERADNRLGDEPSSGLFIASDQVGPLMNAAHNDPALQAALAQEFPGEKLHVLWAALSDAHESGFALLEASGVIEPDAGDITQSQCRSNQTNCDPAGIRLFLATATATPGAPVAPPAMPADTIPQGSVPRDSVPQDSGSQGSVPQDSVPEPPAPSAAPPAAAPVAPPPIANPLNVGQTDWEAAVVMLGNAHDARRDLVMGPGGFLEVWSERDGLMSLVQPASGLGLALWFDWKDDFLVEERCRAMADWRIGWSNEDAARIDELQFTWDGSERSGEVNQGLLAFDQWLQERQTGMRLISVRTHGDFYASFLYPGAGAYRFIAALGAAGVEATLQDGSIPAPASAPRPGPSIARAGAGVGPGTAGAAPRKMPDAPSLAERMRQRAAGAPPTDV